ncbi:predicted protein [Histoplasma capsulatum H143]|uniref:Uncharacterized protein n=1 Tax=Ajellomyces capsulatus (strain H143) TaxID=544712 RepID=C6HMM9_AJECH|nr:predicted protein [Histoplasma capsulatum H143]
MTIKHGYRDQVQRGIRQLLEPLAWFLILASIGALDGDIGAPWLHSTCKCIYGPQLVSEHSVVRGFKEVGARFLNLTQEPFLIFATPG